MKQSTPHTGTRATWRSIGALAATIVIALSSWVVVFGGEGNSLRKALAGEDWFTRIPFEEQTIGYVVMDAKITLSREAQDADLLAIGDSSCQFGCVPEEFERVAGLTTYNLGTVGSAGPVAHAALLRSAFEAGSRPSAVLLWIHPSTLIDKASHAEYAAWLVRRMARPDELGVSRLRAAHDLLGGALRAEVIDFASWTRTTIGEDLNPRNVRARLLETRGWFETGTQAAPDRQTLGELSDETLHELQQIEDLCREFGARLYLFIMPRSTGMRVDSGTWAEITGRIVDALPSATLIEPPSETVDWRLMQSSAHFAADAARSHSAYVARRLRELGEGSD